MSKRNIKNIILLLIILTYSLIHKIFICKNLIDYSQSITTAFTLLFTTLTIKLLGYQKDGNSKIKQSITKGNLIFIIIYIAIYFGLGLYNGFNSNLYFTSIDSTIFNIITIISIEIFRYVIINSNKDKKPVIVFSTISIIIFELLCCNSSILEVVTINILISYLVYNIGIIPGLMYRLSLNPVKNIIPITPDISNSLNIILTITLSLVCYIYSSSKIRKFNIENNKNTNSKIVNTSLIAFVILLLCLVSQIFPYCIIGVGSGSMEPELSLGDAVIVHKLSNNEKIQEGQIIVYNVNNIQVIHRVVEIKNVGDETYYKTKGDANNAIDDINITEDDIYGIVKFKIPFIAKPTVYLNKFLNGE